MHPKPLESRKSPLALYPIWIRPGKSDIDTFMQVFHGRSYGCLDDSEDVGLVIDCGANVGCFSAYMLSRFPECKVISIEPDPDNFRMLRRNLEPYDHRATIGHGAVWSDDRAGIVGLPNTYRDGREWSRQFRSCRPGETAVAMTTTIDVILKWSGFNRISILKIDVEGSEAVIFADPSASWLDKFDRLAIEIHDDSCFGPCTPIVERALEGRGLTRTNHGELALYTRSATPVPTR